MKLKIGDILQDQGGRLHDFSFEQEYNLSEEYSIAGPIHVVGKMMRDSEGVLIVVEEMTANVVLPCEFCDLSIERHIALEKPIERRFVTEIPEEYKGEIVEEVFLIDMHHHTVDLTEMIRQELELRVPFHHACVITNGQCSTCGKEMKAFVEETPTHDPRTQSPFANLKDMLEKGGK